MQSRNMAEAQGDLSIRGGTFEETGLLIGGSTVLTHKRQYTAELIAPENAWRTQGFNRFRQRPSRI